MRFFSDLNKIQNHDNSQALKVETLQNKSQTNDTMKQISASLKLNSEVLGTQNVVQEDTESITGNKCHNFKQIFRRYLFSVKFSSHVVK